MFHSTGLPQVTHKEPSLFLPMSQTLKMYDAHFQAEKVPAV